MTRVIGDYLDSRKTKKHNANDIKIDPKRFQKNDLSPFY